MSRGQAAVDFDAFVAARSVALRRLATLLTGDAARAEDAVQSALVSVWRRWDRISRLDNVDAYVRTAVVNAARTDRRRHRRETPAAEVPDYGLRDASESLGDRDLMWRALSRLPSRQRAVLVLRFYEDLTEVQTAAALGCHVGTVKKYTARALATLRADTRLSSGSEVRP
jgi:RNA polymerase sigma-70 factor (sigma-E family)